MATMFLNNLLNSAFAAHAMQGLNGCRSILSGQGWSTEKRIPNDACGKAYLAMFLRMTMVMLLLAFTASAYAQVGGDGTSGLCEVAKWLKNIATVAALIALFLFVMNSFFAKSSVIGDVIMYIMVGCAVMMAGNFLITKTGLTLSCQV